MTRNGWLALAVIGGGLVLASRRARGGGLNGTKEEHAAEEDRFTHQHERFFDSIFEREEHTGAEACRAALRGMGTSADLLGHDSALLKVGGRSNYAANVTYFKQKVAAWKQACLTRREAGSPPPGASA